MQSMWLFPWTRQFQGATQFVLTSCVQNFCRLFFSAITNHFDSIFNALCFLCPSYFSLMWRVWFHNLLLLQKQDQFYLGKSRVCLVFLVSVVVLSKEEKLEMRSWLAFLICSKFRTRTSIHVDWSQAFSFCR